MSVKEFIHSEFVPRDEANRKILNKELTKEGRK